MKKLLSVIMALTMLFVCSSLTAFAEENETLSADVYVTIANEGTLVVAQEKITVTDIDGDKALTINDALYCTHEAKYDGGAKDGYASYNSEYGLSLVKLWGVENGGSYGYYVNNQSAWSLGDTISDGDYINAFVYTDLTTWSDTYCWFDVASVDVNVNEEIQLTLTGIVGYDYDTYAPITGGIEGATITVNGKKTQYKTDENGKVTITIDTQGEYVISAVSDTQILVPPVCKVTVTDSTVAPATEDTDSTVENTDSTVVPTTEDTNTTKSDTSLTSPKTSDSTNLALYIAVMVIAMGMVITLSVTRKKVYEK